MDSYVYRAVFQRNHLPRKAIQEKMAKALRKRLNSAHTPFENPVKSRNGNSLFVG